jgi:hypothetical protein
MKKLYKFKSAKLLLLVAAVGFVNRVYSQALVIDTTSGRLLLLSQIWPARRLKN